MSQWGLLGVDDHMSYHSSNNPNWTSNFFNIHFWQRHVHLMKLFKHSNVVHHYKMNLNAHIDLHQYYYKLEPWTKVMQHHNNVLHEKPSLINGTWILAFIDLLETLGVCCEDVTT